MFQFLKFAHSDEEFAKYIYEYQPLNIVNSFAGLSSILISSADEIARFIEEVGVTTKKGIWWCWASTANEYVPILFAVSPVFVTYEVTLI